jgi:hypothetical protein
VTSMENDFKAVSACNEAKLEHAKRILKMYLHWIAAAKAKVRTRRPLFDLVSKWDRRTDF